MAGAFPGAEDPAQERRRLEALVALGIRHIINLMQAGEVNRFGRPFRGYEEPLDAVAHSAGSTVIVERRPVKDMGVPDRLGMVRLLDAVDRALAEDRPVYVHCLGGIGRTGTLVGCFLIRHGLTAGHSVMKTLAALRRQHRPAAPDLP